MRLLQRVDRDTHEAVLWLEQHRHLFNKHVFEPILLSVSLLRESTTVCIYVTAIGMIVLQVTGKEYVIKFHAVNAYMYSTCVGNFSEFNTSMIHLVLGKNLMRCSLHVALLASGSEPT